MESAAERKARLKALRAAAEESGVVPARDAGDEPPLKFRNYVPKDAELRAAKIEEAHAAELPEPVLEQPPPEDEDTQEGLLSVQPKKANWDLRRDVAKKLEKLDKRTQRAMVELMRQEEERRTAEAAGQA